MKGSQILITGAPMGYRGECTISGTPKPGTCITVLAATEPVNGRFTYEAYNADADGNQRKVAVLLEDFLQGFAYTRAYVTGERAFYYEPLPGDELNMLVADVSGTGADQDHGIGEVFIIDDGTGKLIATTGTPESEPFVCMETITDQTADLWVWCQFTGY